MKFDVFGQVILEEMIINRTMIRAFMEAGLDTRDIAFMIFGSENFERHIWNALARSDEGETFAAREDYR